MAALIERISSLAGTEPGKVVDLMHKTFKERVLAHGHSGHAFIETLAEICRRHPNMIGIAVGFSVEQFLMAERRSHDAHLAAASATLGSSKEPSTAPVPPAGETAADEETGPTTHHAYAGLHFDASKLKPRRIALEVFGGLVALKFGIAILRRKHDPGSLLATAARIRLFSATFGALYVARAIRSPRVSALRNAFIGGLLTRAVQPLLKADRVRPVRPPLSIPAPAAEPVYS